jgi:uncharacterized membrane protein
MKDTDQILYSAGETVEYARLYLEQKGEIIRLEAAERTAKVTSAIVTAVVLGVLALLVLVLLSVAAGLWLTQLLNSAVTAFLIVAAFFAILGVVVYAFRRQMVTDPSLNFILRKFFEEEEEGPHPFTGQPTQKTQN